MSAARLPWTPWTLIATCGGVGYLPKAPGTFGTLIAVPFAYLLTFVPPVFSMLIILGLAILGLVAAERFGKESGTDDNQHIVIDEFVGYLIAANLLPVTWQSFAAAFILFRFLDITKPLFIGRLDRSLSGGIGVMADDLAAGIVANVLLQYAYYQTTWLGQQFNGSFTL
jgi:phosphatidylglycerophosphatase A